MKALLPHFIVGDGVSPAMSRFVLVASIIWPKVISLPRDVLPATSCPSIPDCSLG